MGLQPRDAVGLREGVALEDEDAVASDGVSRLTNPSLVSSRFLRQHSNFQEACHSLDEDRRHKAIATRMGRRP